jgi:hypothetical protein
MAVVQRSHSSDAGDCGWLPLRQHACTWPLLFSGGQLLLWQARVVMTVYNNNVNLLKCNST